MTAMTTRTASDVYAALASAGLAEPFAPAQEAAFVAALDALFADADESLRPLVAAVQHAGHAYAHTAFDDGLTGGARMVKGGLL